MAYIGTKPTIGNFQICDAISVVNGQAAYTMQVGSVNVVPESANHMIVSLNGVIQKPGSSFTISGSTLTFASNLATGDVIDFVMLLGNVLDLGVPSDATVTAAKIGANAVTAAKLNNDIISGTTALASEPADTDEFLVSDAGTLKRIDYSLIKGGAGLVKLSSQTISSGVSSVDFLSSFSATYDNYVLFYSNLGVVTDSVDLEFRVASSTGTISGSDYYFGQDCTKSNASSASTNTNGTTLFRITFPNMGNASNESASGTISFYGVNDTAHNKIMYSECNGMGTSGDLNGCKTAGVCKTTSALVGFTMFAGSGNIDSGEFVLFGVTK